MGENVTDKNGRSSETHSAEAHATGDDPSDLLDWRLVDAYHMST